MNQCMFRGRLTAKPELKTTTSGKMVTSFSLAVKRDIPNADGSTITDFIDFVAWNKTAETITKWSDKGDELLITDSSCRPSEYTDQNGNKRRKVEFWVNRFEFGAKAGEGSKKGDVPNNTRDYVQPQVQAQSNSAILPGPNARPQKQEQQPATYIMPPSDLVEIGDDEELPF